MYTIHRAALQTWQRAQPLPMPPSPSTDRSQDSLLCVQPKRAKAANLDAIHDTVHEMARDEARHGKAFAGLLKRYFGYCL